MSFPFPSNVLLQARSRVPPCDRIAHSARAASDATRLRLTPTLSLFLLLVPSCSAWGPSRLPAGGQRSPLPSIQPRHPSPPMALDSSRAPSNPAAPAAPTKPPVYSSLLKMARLNTVPMAAGLVFIGAYGARGGVQAAGFSIHHGIQLGLCTLLTVVVTTGSMLINDYHDFMRGVDTIQTKPNRPLPRGDIPPHLVKRALKWLYATHLTLICLVDSAALRLWILGSTMLTYLYSQHLKPRTGVKNFVCALIIAMAVGLGGMAVAGFSQGLAAVWPSMTIIGCGIFHREIMMDIKDLPGDAMTGVPTVPVLLGRNGAWLVSLVPLLLAAGVAATAALTRRAAMTATAPIVAMIALSLKCRVDGFKGIDVAIESAPLWLACSLLSLTS